MGVDRSVAVGVGVYIPEDKYKDLDDGLWDLVKYYITEGKGLLTYGHVGDEWSGTEQGGWVGIKRLTKDFDLDYSEGSGFIDLYTLKPTDEELEAAETVIRELSLDTKLTLFVGIHIH